MRSRAEIKTISRELLNRNYWMLVGVNLVFALITAAISGPTFGMGALILVGPLTIGLNYFHLLIYRRENAEFGTMFNKGFENFGRKLGGYLWMLLFVILWSLLFIIPGIVKFFSYAMAPYILADCPNVKAKDALKLSMRMMAGHKGELFVFMLSFIGWHILSALTFGILQVFYVMPYMQTSLAGFFDEIKKHSLETGVISKGEIE